MPGAGLYKVDASGTTHNDIITSFDDNMLLESEDFTSVWAATGLTITPDATVAPNGKATAEKLLATVTGTNRIAQTVTLTDNLQYAFAADFKRFEAGAEPRLLLIDTNTFTVHAESIFEWFGDVLILKTNVAGAYAIEDRGGGWYRASVICAAGVVVGANTNSFRLYADNSGGKKAVYAWGAQVNPGTSASPYKPTRSATDTQVTLTTGGLTDGDRDGEVFVSGGNDYAVIRNGVDSALVVGNATGEAGACTVAPYTVTQSAIDQLEADSAVSWGTDEQVIEIYDGTYVESPQFGTNIAPTDATPLTIRARAANYDVVLQQSAEPDQRPQWGESSQGVSGIVAERRNDDVMLAWNPATQPSGKPVDYMIEYKIGESGSWTVVGWTADILFPVYDLTPGLTYIFRLRARTLDDGLSQRGSSDTARVTMPADTVPTVSATATAAVVTASVGGNDALDYEVKLQHPNGTKEADATRSGNGDVSLAPASSGRKFVVAWNTAYSEPRVGEVVVPPDSETPTYAYYEVIGLDRVPGAPKKVVKLRRTERPVES